MNTFSLFFNSLYCAVKAFTFSIINNYFNLLTIKLIVLGCASVYFVFYLFIIYGSYKSYQFAMAQIMQEQIYHSHMDLVKLLNNFPIREGQWVPITNDSLKFLLDLNNISHYSHFIYPVNNEVVALQQAIANNPDNASRFSSMVIQQLVENNSRELAEVAEHFVKRVIKYSMPLGALVITLASLHLFGPSMVLA